MEGALTAREADEEAVEQKIIAAHNGHVQHEASRAETHAGLPEIDRLTFKIGDIEAQKTLSQSCTPCRAFRRGEIEPAFEGKKAMHRKRNSGPD